MRAAIDVLRLRLVQANRTPHLTGVAPLYGKSHYFLGNDPAHWHRNVPTYARVQYHDVYPGVDLVYYGHQQQLEYDLIVAPGADPSHIRLAFDGVESLHINAQGELVLGTKGGQLVQRKPVVY